MHGCYDMALYLQDKCDGKVKDIDFYQAIYNQSNNKYPYINYKIIINSLKDKLPFDMVERFDEVPIESSKFQIQEKN